MIKTKIVEVLRKTEKLLKTPLYYHIEWGGGIVVSFIIDATGSLISQTKEAVLEVIENGIDFDTYFRKEN